MNKRFILLIKLDIEPEFSIFNLLLGENAHTDHPKTEYTDQSFSFA
jgi:hypothetical protein